MDLNLYTYTHHPNNINIEDYIHKGSLNKVLYTIDCIIKSGSISLLKDLLIAEENNDFLTRLTNFKIQEYQYNNGSLDKYLFIKAKRNINSEKQKHQDRISYYSTLTPNSLKRDFISSPTTTDYRLINTLKQNIGKGINEPFFDMDKEDRLIAFYDNPFIIESFQRSFNKQFIIQHTLLPVTKDRLNDVCDILNTLIHNEPPLKDEEDERLMAKEYLNKLDVLKNEPDDSLFLIKAEMFTPE